MAGYEFLTFFFLTFIMFVSLQYILTKRNKIIFITLIIVLKTQFSQLNNTNKSFYPYHFVFLSFISVIFYLNNVNNINTHFLSYYLLILLTSQILLTISFYNFLSIDLTKFLPSNIFIYHLFHSFLLYLVNF
jgi:hypothetical protein